MLLVFTKQFLRSDGDNYMRKCGILYVDPYYEQPVIKKWFDHGTTVTRHGVALAIIAQDGGHLPPSLVSLLLHPVVQLMTSLLVW